MKPLISVLLPIYNRPGYVSMAIDSILQQTCSDFELIIIDDGSARPTYEIISRYEKRDSRILIIRNEVNLGITASLTNGLKQARGNLIARMDSDDVSLPERFERQIAYLDHHPEIGILGTRFKRIDENGIVSSSHSIRPCGPNIIWWSMFFFPAVVNPAIMARREYFVKFNENDAEVPYPDAEDYAFWLRIGFEADFQNLPDELLLFRRHQKRITSPNNKIQASSAEKAVQRGLYLALKRTVSLEAIRSYRNLTTGELGPTLEAIDVIKDLVLWFIDNRNLSPEDKRHLSKNVMSIYDAFSNSSPMAHEHLAVALDGLRKRNLHIE